MLRVLILALCAITFAAPGLAQTLYKSVGPDGRITYSDRPPVEGKIQKTLTFDNLPSSSLPAPTSSQLEQARKPQAAAPSTARGQVVLFSAAWCGYCKKAKAYLASRGVAYREFDVDTTEGKAEFVRAGGSRGIPLILAGDHRLQGFSQEAYDAVFLAGR
ncbi:MAG: glutaredoxin family protein [Burkholderiales bacterium]|nr:glutaredoxin family protein [Burkholderiales bacterium]